MRRELSLSRIWRDLNAAETRLATTTVILLLTLPMLASAHPPDDDHTHHATDQASLAKTGAKLINPVSDVWALFTEFDLNFNNGNANKGDDKIGGLMNFQPILPVPLFGEGDDRWKMIVRPAVPIQFAAPRPDGINNTNYDSGLADILLPLLIVPPLENKGIIFGLGPTMVLPTSTKVQLGRRQWQMGPAAVLGYKTKDYVVGVFPQYFWGIGGRGDQGSNIENASNMNLLYFAFLNLPKAWQVGMNSVITYDNKASRVTSGTCRSGSSSPRRPGSERCRSSSSWARSTQS